MKADYLLENGVVVLPCKVGDTMFYAHRIFEEVLEAKLVSIEINSKKDSKVWATIEYISPYTEKQILKANLDVLLNVRLFLTKEEAERALKDQL